MGAELFVARARGYHPDEVGRFVESVLGRSSLASRLGPGCRVLVKPNLCLPLAPERAVTTHPLVVELTVAALQRRGATVVLGDNPIGDGKSQSRRRLWEATGMAAVACRRGCEQSLLDGSPRRHRAWIGGREVEYLLAGEHESADAVVNLPKFKTHVLTGLSGAVKNLFGCVPGRSKARLHRVLPSVDDFAALLVDIYARRPPELTILDAIEGIAGNGPGVSGHPVAPGLLVASEDGVLVDCIAERMLGLSGSLLPTTHEALRRKLGSPEPGAVTLTGLTSLEAIFDLGFDLPETHRYRDPRLVEKMFELKTCSVHVDEAACDGCRACLHLCPMDAIVASGHKVRIDAAKCVQCFCCVETCTKGAMHVRRHPLHAQLEARVRRHHAADDGG